MPYAVVFVGPVAALYDVRYSYFCCHVSLVLAFPGMQSKAASVPL